MDTLIEKLNSMAFETDCDGKVRPFKVVEWDDIMQIIGQPQQTSISLDSCASALMKWYRDTDCNEWTEASDAWKKYCLEGVMLVIDSLKEQGVNIKYQQNIRPPEIEKNDPQNPR